MAAFKEEQLQSLSREINALGDNVWKILLSRGFSKLRCDGERYLTKDEENFLVESFENLGLNLSSRKRRERIALMKEASYELAKLEMAN